uniref:diphosphoinositol-pentakisphosphate 1-kinase n=1 Tax=Toxoplasma gondii COUG TaxID=1074873 RepID=A0A2G8Y4T5_TOXGO|nr:histidine acid phosphatase superfamily protein [Toxoplasma gondii COUG]
MLDAPRDADDRGARSCGSSSSGLIQLSIGVCAMKAKTHSKPMRAILSRLERSLEFRIVVFDEQMILEEDITTWPRVDCLICFYSTGFPLDKAIGYVKRFRPILLNDLEQQRIIRDRVLVYKQLQVRRERARLCRDVFSLHTGWSASRSGPPRQPVSLGADAYPVQRS